MDTFKQYLLKDTYDPTIFKDIRGNIARRKDFVYILPDAFERARRESTSSKRNIPYFKHPYGQILAVANDGKSMMVGTVRCIDNRIIPYEKFRGIFTGKVRVFKRNELVKLDLTETRNINNINIQQ